MEIILGLLHKTQLLYTFCCVLATLVGTPEHVPRDTLVSRKTS